MKFEKYDNCSVLDLPDSDLILVESLKTKSIRESLDIAKEYSDYVKERVERLHRGEQKHSLRPDEIQWSE